MPPNAEYDELVMMVVESALDRPADSRDEYIRSMCGSNRELFEEVLNRIAWEARMGDFLRVPVIERKLAAEQPFQPGELVNDRFRIKRVAGRGGMGVVYEAYDEKVDRRIAIKAARVGFQSRLSPETRSAREVSHYNVCKVHEIHTAATAAGDVDFLTMEFVEGETLDERIRRSGALKPAEAREIAVQICHGLAQAHRQGVVHGDLKCANVILAKNQIGADRAVLTDFGLARLWLGGTGSTGRSERGGTLGYMAPELFLGKPASVASDIYALGVMFHYMLTGKTPERRTEQPESSEDTSASTVTIVKPKTPDWNLDIAALPAPWNAVVTRCLAGDSAKRFQSAAAVARVLETYERRRLWIAIAAAILVIASVLGLWQWRQLRFTAIPVRLAILPLRVEGAPIPLAAGIAQDVATRVSGLRRNFLVIPPNDAIRNRVATGDQAKAVLGATHILSTRLQHSGNQVVMLAQVVDLASGVAVKELNGSYAESDVSPLAKALTATVAGAFHASSPPETVNAAAYPYYVQGIALMARDNLNADRAIPLLQKAVDADSRSAMVYAGLAEAFVQRSIVTGNKQDLEQAGSVIAKAKSLNADSVPVLLVSGIWNEIKSDYPRAIEDFNRAVELEPGNPEPWRRLANLYVRREQMDLAISMYRKAIAAAPDAYRTFLDLGALYFSRGSYNEAEQAFRKVTTVAPGLQTGFSNLGAVLVSMGRFPEAERELREAVRLQKDAAILSNLGALLNLQNRPSEALPLFEEAIALSQPNVILFRNLGYTYRHLGRAGEAAEAYRKGMALSEVEITTDPRRALPHANLALLSAYLNDRKRAAFEAAQALALAPDNVGVIRLAAFTYEILSQRPKTLETLRNAPGYLLSSLNREPDLDQLRRDPQFVELLTSKLAQ